MLIISEQGESDSHHCVFDSALWDSVSVLNLRLKKRTGVVAGKMKHLLVKYYAFYRRIN